MKPTDRNHVRARKKLQEDEDIEDAEKEIKDHMFKYGPIERDVKVLPDQDNLKKRSS